MQRPDQRKRDSITATAARMFATRPYHEVRLDDIAAAAHIGKGTLYVYFDNKEDLYFSLIYDGFARLVDRLKERLGSGAESEAESGAEGGATGVAGPGLPAPEALERIVRELVGFAFAHPHFFELMRSVGKVKGSSESDWNRKRGEFQALVEGTIRRGNRRGEFCDPHPELTALCIGGMVRSVMLFGPKGVGEDEVSLQIYRLLERGIVKQDPRQERQERREKRGSR